MVDSEVRACQRVFWKADEPESVASDAHFCTRRSGRLPVDDRVPDEHRLRGAGGQEVRQCDKTLGVRLAGVGSIAAHDRVSAEKSGQAETLQDAEGRGQRLVRENAKTETASKGDQQVGDAL